MYNRPIHIYSYSTEPINIFHGNYRTDTPPIRLSYHHGNHYNSLVDPRRLTVGAGLGFSCLQGRNVDKDKVKAAIKAQQDQQIDNALLAKGRFCSDLELTEKEIECMVMEASRADYLADDLKLQLGHRESSTSGAAAEPSYPLVPGHREAKPRRKEGGSMDCLIVFLAAACRCCYQWASAICRRSRLTAYLGTMLILWFVIYWRRAIAADRKAKQLSEQSHF